THQTRNPAAIFTQQNAATRTYRHVIGHDRMTGVVTALKYQCEFFATRVITEDLPARNSTATGRGEINQTSVIPGAFQASKTRSTFVVALSVVARIDGLRQINSDPFNFPTSCVGITCT